MDHWNPAPPGSRRNNPFPGILELCVCTGCRPWEQRPRLVLPLRGAPSCAQQRSRLCVVWECTKKENTDSLLYKISLKYTKSREKQPISSPSKTLDIVPAPNAELYGPDTAAPSPSSHCRVQGSHTSLCAVPTQLTLQNYSKIRHPSLIFNICQVMWWSDYA